MTRVAYVDTSIITDALLKWGAARKNALLSIKHYEQTLLPDYAVREFQAGPLQNYIYAHNCFANKRTLDDVHEKINALGHTRQRNKFLTASGALSGARTATTRKYEKLIAERKLRWREGETFRLRFIRTHLANKIFAALAGIEKVCTTRTHRLDCIENIKLKLANEEIRSTSNRMDCAKAAKCDLAKHLSAQREALTKILAATVEHSRKCAKPELTRRAQAIEAVLDGKVALRGVCRALGDAVFAALAPTDATILTTNAEDHVAIATCLGKSVNTR